MDSPQTKPKLKPWIFLAHSVPRWNARDIIHITNQSNARAHTGVVTIAKIYDLGYKLLPHPPHFGDLVRSDDLLHPNLKK